MINYFSHDYSDFEPLNQRKEVKNNALKMLQTSDNWPLFLAASLWSSSCAMLPPATLLLMIFWSSNSSWTLLSRTVQVSTKRLVPCILGTYRLRFVLGTSAGYKNLTFLGANFTLKITHILIIMTIELWVLLTTCHWCSASTIKSCLLWNM